MRRGRRMLSGHWPTADEDKEMSYTQEGATPAEVQEKSLSSTAYELVTPLSIRKNHPRERVMSPEAQGAQGPAKFFVEIIKPSHYDDDGYVIQWVRAFVPSNSLACLYALVQDVQQRRVLGAEV